MCDHRPFRRCEPKEEPPRSAIELLREADRRKRKREMINRIYEIEETLNSEHVTAEQAIELLKEAERRKKERGEKKEHRMWGDI